ncbi:hypothetical protein GSbR_33350 [Geobacter sp. SVR]|nr:hypothetical protein GSbR_33350 [Geobacter sp. SVR]
MINAAEHGGQVAISGTTTGAENGRTVTVHLNGHDYTATVSNNTWTLNAPAIDVAALLDGRGYTVTADVSDAAGNAAPQAGRTITVDTTAPVIAIILDKVTPDNVLDPGEAGGTVTLTGRVSGEVNPGDTVTLVIDGTTYTALVQNDKTFSVDVPGSKLASDSDLTINTSVTTTDAAGNSTTATGIKTYLKPPVASNDTATAIEAGGVNNATPGADAVGNVLTNDATADPGGTKTVVSATGTGTGQVGGATSGLYGVLTLNADGSYSYVVNNSNAAVQALNTGEALTDTFTYTMRDANGLTDSAVLTVTIQGANDSPVVTLNTGSIVSALQVPVRFGGLHVDDVDSPVMTVTLSVEHGVLLVTDPGSPNLTVTGNGSNRVTLSGSLAEINALIGGSTALTYTPDYSFSGNDSFIMSTNDGHATVATSTGILVTQRPPVTEDPRTSGQGNTATPVTPVISLPPVQVTVSPDSLVSTSGHPSPVNSLEPALGVRTSVGPAPELTSMATSRNGLVILGGEDTLGAPAGLYLVKTPSSQESLVEEVSSFNLPQGIFRHSDMNAKVALAATLSDGSPLPNWMTFDAESGRFTAKPPVGSGGAMDIRITARDQNGNVAEAQFLFHITESKSGKPETVDTDSADKKPAQKDQKPARDSRDTSASPRSDALDLLKPQKYAARTLKGRPSLAEQMASAAGKDREPVFLAALHKAGKTVRQ